LELFGTTLQAKKSKIATFDQQTTEEKAGDDVQNDSISDDINNDAADDDNIVDEQSITQSQPEPQQQAAQKATVVPIHANIS
jgi:hypothetical protein